MMRRAFIKLIGGLAIAMPLASYAQQPKEPPKRIGLLAAFFPCPLQSDNLVIRRLEELGWVEGQTMVLDCVSAVGRIDQVPALARELVSRRPDVLMAAGSAEFHRRHRAGCAPGQGGGASRSDAAGTRTGQRDPLRRPRNGQALS